MEKWSYVVRCNCVDELREDDFINSYNEFCLPNFVGLPECTRASLSVNPDISSFESGKYMAVFELETDDIGKTVQTIFKNVEKWRKEERFNTLSAPVSFALYRQVNSMTK